ncbi:hypothetical protein CBR_g66785 [Chara braunii]|uniref:O-fucosyltransferase family protein n=1 Tax=Chara braunii TaxID=69332 RepID=A0A388K9E5_CHABU|nr:hypothetical protein CBR_g66785 [Chara braunii]|eukprot:GBG66649.1 hypothetical protein CBR_g66785 [Chara braunii]
MTWSCYCTRLFRRLTPGPLTGMGMGGVGKGKGKGKGMDVWQSIGLKKASGSCCGFSPISEMAERMCGSSCTSSSSACGGSCSLCSCASASASASSSSKLNSVAHSPARLTKRGIRTARGQPPMFLLLLLSVGALSIFHQTLIDILMKRHARLSRPNTGEADKMVSTAKYIPVDWPNLPENERVTLWERPAPNGLKPCINYTADEDSVIAHYNPEAYILVSCNGGLNQQRAAIVNAVLVALHLNMTLLVPYLQRNPVWNDASTFGEIFNLDKFIRSLRGTVRIKSHVPAKALIPEVMYFTSVPAAVNFSWYNRHVRAKVNQANRLAEIHEMVKKEETETTPKEQKRVVVINPFAHRLSHHLPLFWQKLRCFVNFQALKFVDRIEKLGAQMVNRMKARSNGRYLALHLRFEEDMVAYSMCDFGGGEDEHKRLHEYRKSHWNLDNRRKRETLNPARLRAQGKCPVTPEEAGLFLRALGFPHDTHIYMASLIDHLYGGNDSIEPLKTLFPNLVDKTSLATKVCQVTTIPSPNLRNIIILVILLLVVIIIIINERVRNVANCREALGCARPLPRQT